MAHGAGRPRVARRGAAARMPTRRRRTWSSCCPLRQRRGDRLRRAPEAAALRRFPERAGDGAAACGARRQQRPSSARGGGMNAGYNFAYLDEQTKRMIRRAILKAVAIPGHQVPFGSREMPLPYGWGTGGIQVTASVLGPDDTLKVIDQGADDTTNAVSHPPLLRPHRRRAPPRRARAEATHHPDPPPHPRDAAARRPDPGLPGAACPSRCPGSSRSRAETQADARAGRLRADACQALRGHHPATAMSRPATTIR